MATQHTYFREVMRSYIAQKYNRCRWPVCIQTCIIGGELLWKCSSEFGHTLGLEVRSLVPIVPFHWVRSLNNYSFLSQNLTKLFNFRVSKVKVILGKPFASFCMIEVPVLFIGICLLWYKRKHAARENLKWIFSGVEASVKSLGMGH